MKEKKKRKKKRNRKKETDYTEPLFFLNRDKMPTFGAPAPKLVHFAAVQKSPADSVLVALPQGKK